MDDMPVSGAGWVCSAQPSRQGYAQFVRHVNRFPSPMWRWLLKEEVQQVRQRFSRRKLADAQSRLEERL